MKKAASQWTKIRKIILFVLIIGGVIAGWLDQKERKGSKHKARGLYEAFFKRPMDFICGTLTMMIFWPVYLIIAALVKIKLGSPVLFSQDRPGKNEKIFKLYKFRTMTDERDEKGELLPDDKRLTKFGKILRSTSLDELPEVFNIIKGDMSVVGPRPLLVKYLPYYTDEEKTRHSVRPGLTGLAQINGRNYLQWDERLAFDVKYVNDLTLFHDVSILFKTIWKVLKRSDVAEKRIIPFDQERQQAGQEKQ